MTARTMGFAIGLPTAVDVAALVKAFGVPAPGTDIAYQDIEAVIKAKHTADRFKTVTTAWRRKLERESNVLLGTIPGSAFTVLSNVGRVDHVARKTKTGMRAVKVASRRAASTPRDGLTAEQGRTLDHVVTLDAAMRVQSALEARKLRALPEPPA